MSENLENECMELAAKAHELAVEELGESVDENSVFVLCCLYKRERGLAGTHEDAVWLAKSLKIEMPGLCEMKRRLKAVPKEIVSSAIRKCGRGNPGVLAAQRRMIAIMREAA